MSGTIARARTLPDLQTLADRAVQAEFDGHHLPSVAAWASHMGGRLTVTLTGTPADTRTARWLLDGYQFAIIQESR